MDIVSASHYMREGYRVRRASWGPKDYLKSSGGWLEKTYETYWYGLVQGEKGATKHLYMTTDDMSPLHLEDMLANDWEIITDNIRKYYNKYFHMEYNDDIDFDNYVHDDSGWGDEDE